VRDVLPKVVRLSKVTRAKHLLLTSFVVLLLSTTLSKAGSGDAYTIKMLRWDEDYSYLRGDEDLAFPLSLKYLHFTNDGYISLGGEYRLRLESYEHPNPALTLPRFRWIIVDYDDKKRSHAI
jgi:hypothetical protein